MHLSLTTPAGSIVDTETAEVSAPGALGALGILPGHVPLLTALQPGVLAYASADGTRALAVGRGILQVARGERGERVLVLADRAAHAAEIDRDAAAAEVAACDEELARWRGDFGGEYQALVDRRAWATARVNAAGRS